MTVISDRWFMIWLGSYLLAAIVLFFFIHVPLGPIFLGGIATFIISLYKFRKK